MTIEVNDLTIVTRCMNRLDHLQQSLPTWIQIPDIKEILIVDWNSSQDLKSLLNIDSRIKIIRVDDQKYFNRGAAWNTGIKHVQTDFVFCVDCDVLILRPLMFSVLKLNMLNKAFYKVEHDFSSLYGTCIFRKIDWKTIGGYIENTPTWGSEDYYFYQGLKKSGLREIFLKGSLFHHIEHDNRMRFENQEIQWDINPVQNIKKSRETNLGDYVLMQACSYNDQFIKNQGKIPMKEYSVNIFSSTCNSSGNKCFDSIPKILEVFSTKYF